MRIDEDRSREDNNLSHFIASHQNNAARSAHHSALGEFRVLCRVSCRKPFFSGEGVHVRGNEGGVVRGEPIALTSERAARCYVIGAGIYHHSRHWQAGGQSRLKCHPVERGVRARL